MVGIGLVGIGFMGMTHYRAAGRVSGGRVLALCSRDPAKRAGDWRGIQGNFGPAGERMDLSGVATYDGLDGLLADPGVDLVDLCVPTGEHRRMAIRALEAGKDVLVEKPIALTTEDADAMIAAARSSGRRLMVAHVVPFFAEFAFAREAVASGRYGALRAAHFTRVIAGPDRTADGGSADRDDGGPAIDLHIHDSHFVSLICGAPRAVQSRGVVESGTVVHLATQYLFSEPSLTVSAVTGALGQPGRPFAHGFELYLERATIAFAYPGSGGTGDESAPVWVALPDGRVERPEVGSSDSIDVFARELAEAVEALASGRPSPALDAPLARRALATCLAEVESVRTGRPVMLG